MANTYVPIGIVAPVARGDWDASVQYNKLNIVNYNGGSWMAKKASVNVAPAPGEYWQAFGGASYTAGDGISIENNVISINLPAAEGSAF